MPNEIPQEIVDKIRHIADISNGNTEQERQLLIIFGYHLRDSAVDIMNRMINEQQEILHEKDQRIKELEEALEKIVKWNEHSIKFAVDFGSNGVRDIYRNIAKEALDQQMKIANEMGDLNEQFQTLKQKDERIKELEEQVEEAKQFLSALNRDK